MTQRDHFIDPRKIRPARGPSAIGLLCLACVPLFVGCGSFAASGRNAEGVRLFEQARYQEAMAQFQQALTEDPDNADSYYNLAAGYHQFGKLNGNTTDLQRAEEYYRHCMARDPDHCECYRGLAVLLAEQNRHAEALQLLQSWADSSPLLADPKIELARLSTELGDRATAQQQLAEAVLIEPNNTRALAALGSLREQTGDATLAMQNYRQSLAVNPFQPAVAARVATLQSAANAGQMGFSSNGSRLATTPPPAYR